MKKSLIALVFVLLISFSSAVCSPTISLVNQDPFPAVPGDYVKVVFQLKGIETVDCRDVIFEVVPEYPFSLDASETGQIKIKGGTFINDFNSFLMAPFKLRVDADAIDGNNPLKVKYSTDNTLSSHITEQFDIEIKDIKADFEVFIRDYNPSTRTLTLEILNIGKEDIEALTIEIPVQENIIVKGANRKIIGALDSNEDTTVEFEVPTIKEGEIQIQVAYTDIVNIRRTTSEKITFNPSFFENLKRDEKGTSSTLYLIVIIIIIAVIYFFYQRHKKNKKKKLLGSR